MKWLVDGKPKQTNSKEYCHVFWLLKDKRYRKRFSLSESKFSNAEYSF
jgi:hypothetical protein